MARKVLLGYRVGDVGDDLHTQMARARITFWQLQLEAARDRAINAKQRVVEGHLNVQQHFVVAVEIAHDHAFLPRSGSWLIAVVTRLPSHRQGCARFERTRRRGNGEVADAEVRPGPRTEDNLDRL